MTDRPGNPGERLALRTLEMLQIPSPSGEESAMAGFVESFLRSSTQPVFLRRRGNAVVAAYGSETPALVLAGHLDTVPDAGCVPPERTPERIQGRGSTDMKGGLAVMLELAARRARSVGDCETPLGLVFYDCEEVAYEKNGLRPLFESEPWINEAALALLMEPTANVLELGCLGTLHALIAFRGTAAHSARPWTGENAIHRAAPFLSRVAGMPAREFRDGPAVFQEVLNVTLAQGGSTRNVIPDRFTLNLNLRFPPDRTPEEAERYLRSLLPEKVDVEITDLAPGAPAHGDASALKPLLKLGLTVRAKQAWTDVAQFALRGVPAANFGPGIPELAHKQNESVPVENLVRSLKVLEKFLSQGGSAE